MARGRSFLPACLLLLAIVHGSFAARELKQAATNIVTVEPDINPDPKVSGAWEQIGVSFVIGTQLAMVPGTDKVWLAERPSSRHPDGKHFNNGVYDIAARKFVNYDCATSLENCAASFTKNGTVMVLAGHKPQGGFPEGRKGIRVLDMENKDLKQVGELTFGHWLATSTVLPNGYITVMSDSPKGSGVEPPKGYPIQNPFYELVDPENPERSAAVIQMSKAFTSKAKYFYYPFAFVLPTGDLFVWGSKYGEIIEPMSGKTKKVLPTWGNIPAAKKLETAYPFGGNAVLMPLYPETGYATEVAIFGGAFSYGWINTTGSDLSLRLSIDTNADGSYKIGKWVSEKMPSPRLSHSSLLLPNGKIILMGGAKRGQLGDAAAGGVSMANDPNFWPVVFDPQAPVDSADRWVTLQRTQIPRMLHSAVGLTTNGTVFVAGFDRADKFWSPFNYSKSPTGFSEYRLELFSPPEVFETDKQPEIVSDVPDVVAYGETFNVEYVIPNADLTVTSAVLVAPSSDTHTFNMHQRLVGLELRVAEDTHATATNEFKSVELVAPPNSNIAPPGKYMLFLLVDRVWGPAKWVQISEESAANSEL